MTLQEQAENLAQQYVEARLTTLMGQDTHVDIVGLTTVMEKQALDVLNFALPLLENNRG